MGRIIHFEIHATNPEQLADFYRDLFGWDIQNWGGPIEYWMVRTGADDEPGVNGGLLRRQGQAPPRGQSANAFVCTVQVDDVDAALAKAQGLGGTMAMPKAPVPGVGWLAYILDPDGNLVGLMQTDASVTGA